MKQASEAQNQGREDDTHSHLQQQKKGFPFFLGKELDRLDPLPLVYLLPLPAYVEFLLLVKFLYLILETRFKVRFLLLSLVRSFLLFVDVPVCLRRRALLTSFRCLHKKTPQREPRSPVACCDGDET